jgi:hypothetical protein
MCCSLFGTFSLGLVNVSFVTSYAKLLAFGLGESATTKPVNLVVGLLKKAKEDSEDVTVPSWIKVRPTASPQLACQLLRS